MNDPYYKTKAHREWREKVLRRDKYLCRECARYGRHVVATHAHHIQPRAERPDLARVIANGISLCSACHNKLEPRVPRRDRSPHPSPLPGGNPGTGGGQGLPSERGN